MNDKQKKEINDIVGDYKFGFKTEAKTVVDTGKGLSEEVVRKISELKCEPDWMLEFRLKAYHKFVEMEQPNFGPNLDFIDFNDYTYYIKSSEGVSKTWDDVPEEIKDTFEKLGIPEAERDYLAGVTTQFESEAVYHHNMEELEKQGVLFCDTDTALKKYPDIFKKYFATIVPYTDNKYAALNSAVWSGGSF
ncbi:MAG: Fe-S cluster assembly protein SufB, partial [Bacilli bacterium]|nr:Fe-S cluster assembly protein SufB [Bacilli bacterium]